MRVLILHTAAIDPQKGGIEKASRVLADALISRGNTVFFMAMMAVFRETCDRSLQFFFPSEKIYTTKNELFLKNFLKEKKIDVCIFQAGDDKRVPFPRVFRETGVKLIVAVHTDPEFFRPLVRGKFELKYGNTAVRLLLPIVALKIFFRKRKQMKLYAGNAAAAERIVLLSSKFFPRFSKYVKKEDRCKVCAIPNAIEKIPNNSDISAKQKEILYVGRMSLGEKRTDLLLKIWKEVQDDFPDWRLTLVGGGSDEEKLRKLAARLRLKRISFEGFQNPEKYYARASVFCLTSAFEGFGLVLVEASAFGCVPMAFNSYPTADEIIRSGTNGILVPAFDLRSYADELRLLMRNNALRNQFSVAAHKNATRFSVENIIPLWENVLKN